MQEVLGIECEMAFKAASFFSGGMACTGNLCGALSGGVMALGMVYGRANPRIGGVHDGSGPALRLVKWFEKEYGTSNCCELTGVPDMLNKELRSKLLVGEVHERCFRRSGEVAAKVVDIVSKQGSRQVSLDEAIAELKAEGLL
ncbi:MAG: C_GCAxxG_C_C family protein [Chloroflexi bacterium]|nr:C_GCAxxG_C_C family protein [Chloroflexota bacterium]